MDYPASPFIRTSHSHPLRIDALRPHPGWGRLGITFCPGKRGPGLSGCMWERDLDADVQALRAWEASTVVTLLEAHELTRLRVPLLGHKVSEAGLRWCHAPMRDGRPADARFEATWPALQADLLATLHEGRSVVVHCRGALGRAGTVAALLLAASGVDPRQAVARVRAARPGAIETEGQLRYVVTRAQTPSAADAGLGGRHGLV